MVWKEISQLKRKLKNNINKRQERSIKNIRKSTIQYLNHQLKSQLLRKRNQLKRNQMPNLLILRLLNLKQKPRNQKFLLTTNLMLNLVQRRQKKNHRKNLKKNHRKRKYRKSQLRLLKQNKIKNLKKSKNKWR